MPFRLCDPYRLQARSPLLSTRIAQPLAQLVAQSGKKHLEVRLISVDAIRFPVQQVLEVPYERMHIALPIRKRLQCPVDTAEHEVRIGLTVLLPIESPRMEHIREMPEGRPLGLPYQFSRTMSDEKLLSPYDHENHSSLMQQRIDIPECPTRSRRPYPSHISLLSSPKNKTGYRIKPLKACQSTPPNDV